MFIKKFGLIALILCIFLTIGYFAVNTGAVSTVLLAIQGAITDGNLVKFSGTNGIGVDTGLSATNVVKCKFDATSAPTVNDDVSEGYTVGSGWLDVTNDKSYICFDNADGAAVWIKTTGFVDQTAWRIFYSDGEGNVTELALGIDGTYLKSTGVTSAPEFNTPPGAGDMNKSTYDTDEDGDIDVAAGGTEKSLWTQYAIPYLSGTTDFGEIPIGAAEYALTVNATATGYDFTLFDLSLYYLKTEIDTLGEVEAIYIKDITDSDELATALTDYYLKTAIDTQGELEEIWGVTLATDTELAALTYSDVGAEQADAGLTSLAGLTYVSPSFIKVTATDTYAIRTIAETITDLALDSDDLSDVASIAMLDENEDITEAWTISTGSIAGVDATKFGYLADITAFGASIIDDADEATFKATVNLEIGTDVLAYQAIGIADNNLVEMDDLDAAIDDYCKLTANGIVGRSYAEVKTDLGIDLSLYYLKTEIDTLSEVETIYSKDIIDSDELSALDYKGKNYYSALGSDHTYSDNADIDSQPVGESVVFGDLLYFNWTDKEWKKTDADAAATMPGERIALESKTDGQTCLMLVKGYIRDDSAFEFAGAMIYTSVTPGAMSSTAPTETGDQVQRVGTAKSADILFFNPSIDVGEI